MSETINNEYESGLRQYLTGQVSRARMLAGVGAAGAALAVGPGLVSAQSATETVQDIINIADTAEHLAVTLLTAAVGNASQLGLTANGGLLLSVVQAALAEEQYHADFLESAGAKTLTDTFTLPDPKIATDFTTFFTTVASLETAFVAAYLRASTEFSQMKNRQLAQVAMEIGGVEAEHRALARAALALNGTTADDPPNNKAFESDLFAKVADAATALQQLGFIGGTGSQLTYPGRSAALAAAGPMASAVTNQQPQ